MSGGVDSAVALLKAVEAGLEPVGVTLRLWIDPAAPDSERACCSPSSVRAARSACHALDVPHVTLDLREGFRRAVVEEFVGAHRRGLTPNPCVRCNGSFRFDALIGFADRIGAPRLATGHYARVVRRDGRALLARGADPARTSRTCSPRSPRRSWRASGFRWASSTRPQPGRRRGSGRPGSCREGGEPGGVLRRRRRPPRLPRALRRGGAGRRDRGRGRARDRQARRRPPVHGRPAPRPGRRRRPGALRAAHRAGVRPCGRGDRSQLAVRRVRVSPGEVFVPVDHALVRLRYRGARSRPGWCRLGTASSWSWTSRHSAWPPDRLPSCTTATPWSGPVGSPRPAPL